MKREDLRAFFSGGGAAKNFPSFAIEHHLRAPNKRGRPTRACTICYSDIGNLSATRITCQPSCAKEQERRSRRRRERKRDRRRHGYEARWSLPERQCCMCPNKFIPCRRTHIACSIECRKKRAAITMRDLRLGLKNLRFVVCRYTICGQRVQRRGLYCSDACRSAAVAAKKMEKWNWKECVICSKKVLVPTKRVTAVCISNLCRSENKKRHRHKYLRNNVAKERRRQQVYRAKVSGVLMALRDELNLRARYG